ncbi:hypothetical protein ACFY1P_20740 [Streptomyces sp. NPDC001407]|uniref:hypothetical protein n=1 Tax=Streptomyces sp. NPDC001407 TaxID=3364573 RepID=UPI0036BC421E
MSNVSAGFPVITGEESPSGLGESPENRAASVRRAMEGLWQIRKTTNPSSGRAVSVPAQWERLQPVRAIALALEAARIPASTVGADGRRLSTGYRVYQADGAVRVEWLGPPGSRARYEQHQELARCAAALQDLGWQTLEYRGARGHRWLEVEAPPSA